MTKFQPTKISEVKKIWEEEGFSFKKKLSQNFLIDQNIVDKIINESEVVEGDTVLEIGPGSGALTLTMLERGATVYAVEVDERASRILEKHLTEYPNFHLIKNDILNADISFLPSSTKVVSNLPYHITSPIIAKLAAEGNKLSKITLMVQKEMAQRIMAKAPSTERSSFSVFTSFHFVKKLCFVVKPGCFIPKPKVDSVIITLIPKTVKEIEDPAAFVAFVRKAFSQKRKMISSVFKDTSIKTSLAAIGKKETCRPQELSTEDFIRLYNLHSSSLKE